MLKRIFVSFIITMPLLLNAQAISNDSVQDGDQIYSTVSLSIEPNYPGGLNAFYKHVSKNFNIPEVVEEDLNVRVLTSFVIEKDGTITDIKILKDPGFGLAQEAKRVLMTVPEKWSPGIMDGKPVRVNYTLPIQVKLTVPKRKEKQ